MKQYITLTDQQKSIFEQAVELLIPLAQEEEERLSGSTVYFKVNDEDVSSEYDTCDNEECIEESKNEIRKNYGNDVEIEENWYDNDGDHEHIERCSICGRPLVCSLTWIEQEFEHHEEHSVNLSDFKDGCTAFDVKVMLDAMPSCDHSIDEYAFHQNSIGNSEPLERQTKWQNEFVERVVNYAQKVVTILSE